jgi:acetyl esterase/lipase
MPVVVYFHGGGYAIGDKSQQIADKTKLFTSAGWGFVSVNYRLSPYPVQLDNPDRIRYPMAQQDAAAAIKWVVDHAASFGLDGQRLLVVGHSAGAHLTALLANDPRFLAAQGLTTDRLRCIALLDTEAYDLEALVRDGSDEAADLYQNAVGTDQASLQAASPIRYVRPNLPWQWVVTRGTARRQAQASAYVDAVQQAGSVASLVRAVGYSHADVNRQLGVPGETTITPGLMDFFTTCAAR